MSSITVLKTGKFLNSEGHLTSKSSRRDCVLALAKKKEVETCPMEPKPDREKGEDREVIHWEKVGCLRK